MRQPGPGLDLWTKETRQCVALDGMARVVSCAPLAPCVEPRPKGVRADGLPFGIGAMPGIHRPLCRLSRPDPSTDQALHDRPLFGDFARLDARAARLPGQASLRRFRHPLVSHDLATGLRWLVRELLRARGLTTEKVTVADAMLIAAPRSTHNDSGARDAGMLRRVEGAAFAGVFSRDAHPRSEAAGPARRGALRPGLQRHEPAGATVQPTW